MNLESQVTSLELSKKLKELGFKQESLFFHNPIVGGTYQIDMMQSYTSSKKSFSAYTVAELGEMLNIELTDANELESYTLKISSAIDFWVITFGNDEIDTTPQIEDVSLVDALAKMLIYLKENNLLN